LNVQGGFAVNPQTIRQLLNNANSKYDFGKRGKRVHDFSLVLSKHDDSVVVACRDYPGCMDMITIFGVRD
jgi:hypothetical protein